MESLANDVRHAARRLIRSPGFTLAALVTLALGIGANTAMFSVIHAVLLRPLLYPEPDELVRVWESAEDLAGFSTVSPPNFMDFRSLEDVFRGAAAHYSQGLTLTGEGDAERLTAATVSPALFSVLGVGPALGRAFRQEEETPGRDRVTILSHGLWERRLGSDPGVVGRGIELDGTSYEVVGVMPEGFDYPEGADLWVPAAFSAEELANNRGGHYLKVVARLHEGVSIERANLEVQALAERLAERYPDTNEGQTARVVGMREDLVGDYRSALLILAGAVAVVLLIACVNVANLFLVRAVDRQRDLAVRTALGAGRTRLLRGMLVESLLLALAGGALGALIATWGTDALVALQSSNVPRLGDVALDETVLSFTLLISLATGVLFGTLPAWRASRPDDLAEQLKAGRGQSEGRSGSRLRSTLVVSEIALALLLLTGAALLMRSFARLTAVDLGVRTERVLTFSLALPESRYPEGARARQFFEDYLGSVAGVAEVESAAGVFPGLPLSGTSFQFSVPRIDGAPVDEASGTDRVVQLRVVTPAYRKVMGIALRDGRFLGEEDRAGTEPAVVLNESAARLLFPAGEPLGHTLELSTDLGLEGGHLGGRVVGIIGDVKEFGPARDAPPVAYFAHAQYPVPSMAMVVRTPGDPGAVMGALRGRLAEIDPQLPAYRIRTMEQLANSSVTQPRFYTLLLSVFGCVALILAAVGTYGSIAYNVERRGREIGIRLALGARAGDVLRMVVASVARLAGLGLVIGLVVGLLATRLLADLLYDLSPTDPVAMVASAVVLAGAALLAGWLPARRAARVDPMTVIRME